MTHTLSELLQPVAVEAVHGDAATTVAGLTYDSRSVRAGDCFFAVRGTQCDGHAFIPAAVAAGASAVVCEELPAELSSATAYVVVSDTQAAMAGMAAAFYGDPSRQLRLVGVTGTNGKTTTVTLLYDTVRALGHKAGLISTVVYRIDDRLLTTKNH